MKVEVESVKNLVCSQVFTWKLKCSKAEWDDKEKRISFKLPDGDILRNVFKRCSCGNSGPMAHLSLRPRGACWAGSGTEAEGKKRGFVFHFVPETEKKFEHRVLLRVRDESKLLITSELTTFMASKTEDKVKWNTLSLRKSKDYLSFSKILHVEATITILAASSDRNVSLAPKIFMDNTRKIRMMKENADMTVMCEGKVFPCHKVILRSQCPVFETFLTGDTKENQESQIEIKETTPEAVELLLKYLYEGEVKEISEDAVLDVLNLANKYDLAPLKFICGESLLKNLTIDNFMVTYTEIDRFFGFGESDLMKDLKTFLKLKAKDIVKNKEGWVEFAKKFPEVSHEVVMSLASWI